MKNIFVLIVIVIAFLISFGSCTAEVPQKLTTLDNPLAIRLSCYGRFENDGWAHAASIGLHYLFLSVPAPNDISTIEKRLAEHNLRPLVLRGNADLGNESSIGELSEQLATCQKMGVHYMFLSPKHTGISKELAYEKLRRLGDIARKHEVTVVLETHPDLGTNADEHLKTMQQVNHPNIRVNFDTGNITFYNRGTDAVTELKKIIDYVATVELKDHSGKYQEWNFPTLGKGVVDFPAVLKILQDHHFRGPITIEVEGTQGVTMDKSTTEQYIADSVKYIQSLGNFR